MKRTGKYHKLLGQGRGGGGGGEGKNILNGGCCYAVSISGLAQLAQIIANGSTTGTPYSNCISILVIEFT